MSVEIITSLTASILGVIVGAVANYLFTKKKVQAEIKKLEAETEKTKMEAAKLSVELNSSSPRDDKRLKEVKKPGDESTNLSIFWQTILGKELNKKIYIVLSAKSGYEWVQGSPTPRAGHTALLSYNEVVAFLKLQETLEQVNEKAILVHGGIEDPQNKKVYIPEFPEDETLVIIGSPNAHKFCQRLLSSPRLVQIPFRFEVNEEGKCINCYQDENGKWSKKPLLSFPSVNNDDNKLHDDIEEDFGIILRISNPRDPSNNNKMLIMGGNHGLGTESAVNFLTDNNRIKILNKLVQDQDFAVIFQASVSKNKGLGLGIRRLAVLNNGIWIPVKVA